jgi:hypothetical protein
MEDDMDEADDDGDKDWAKEHGEGTSGLCVVEDKSFDDEEKETSA